MSLNKVTLQGNLTDDPKKISMSDSGSQMVVFSVATNRKYKNKEGELVDSVTYTSCKSFSKYIIERLEVAKKGSEVFLEGRLSTYKDKEGNFKTNVEVLTLLVGVGKQEQSAQVPY